ncbi:MAG: CDP-archaeol synthase [Thermoplasmata archaeon]|nr:CDP-archaeol synthase [Thermoplasmata archaeon]
MVDPHLGVLIQVLWVLTPVYAANALATLPKGRGPSMDLGRNWSDGRRILGGSKTWSGFLFGTFAALPIALLQAWLILIAPPNLQLVPHYGSTVAAAIPVAFLLTGGALAGDAIGSFLKRRLGYTSGERVLGLDQFPFVLVPIGLGLVLYPAIFVPTFLSVEALLWVLLLTVVLHFGFNWIGFRIGTKKVPW